MSARIPLVYSEEDIIAGFVGEYTAAIVVLNGV